LSLWFAVLAQALTDASGTPHSLAAYSSRSRLTRADRLFIEARQWVANNACHVGTFRWCCEIFELDPDLVRQSLKTGTPIHFARDLSAQCA
jgi:hypothetical protein